MADLSFGEKKKLERALHMGGGYVLGFSNSTFEEFVHDSVGAEIYDPKYNKQSGSKANRLRAFWEREPNWRVGQLLRSMLDSWDEVAGADWDPKGESMPHKYPTEIEPIVTRLEMELPVAEIEALAAVTDDTDFDKLGQSVRKYIDDNQPESGLDRLHTFTVKFFRAVLKRRNIAVDKAKPLHSLVGEYRKIAKAEGLYESEMADRILKTTISIMESFNAVRNDQSLAHDNAVLSYEEALLIFNNVTSMIRFVKSLESRPPCEAGDSLDDLDHVPF